MDFQLLRPAIGIIRNLCCVSPKHREFIAEKHELIPVVMSSMKRHYTHPFLVRNAAFDALRGLQSPFMPGKLQSVAVSSFAACASTIRQSEARDRSLLQKILQLMVNICSVQVGLENRPLINETIATKASEPSSSRSLMTGIQTKRTSQDADIVRLAGAVLQAAEKHKDLLEEKPVPKEDREFYLYVFGGHLTRIISTLESAWHGTMKWVVFRRRATYRPAWSSPDGRYPTRLYNEDEKLASVEVLDTGKVPMEWMEMEEMPSARSHLWSTAASFTVHLCCGGTMDW